MSVIQALRKQRQEVCHEFRVNGANLDLRVELTVSLKNKVKQNKIAKHCPERLWYFPPPSAGQFIARFFFTILWRFSSCLLSVF